MNFLVIPWSKCRFYPHQNFPSWRKLKDSSRCSAFIFLTLSLASCSLSSFARENDHGYEEVNCLGSHSSAETLSLYVTNLGWHTGIVIPSDAIREKLAPFINEVNLFPWIEVGWGDREFYLSSGYSYWKALKAALFSSGTVLHVVAFSESPRIFFAESELIRVRISAGKIDELAGVLQSSLAANDHQTVRLGDSLYGSGSFYEAKGNFSLLHTCNSWTAEALSTLGCKIDPHVRRASSVMKNLRGLSN